MRKRTGYRKFIISTLPGDTPLTCNCPTEYYSWDKPTFGDLNGMEAIIGREFSPGTISVRVMRQYFDGTTKHARCGKISQPIVVA